MILAVFDLSPLTPWINSFLVVILTNKPQTLYKQNYVQFLFVVKATAVKQETWILN